MKKFSVRTLAFAGVLIAMNIELSRFVSTPIGPPLRISVSSVPIILCGLWMGPLVGGIAGCAGDLLGCLVSGYACNPLITLSAILMGVIPALFKNFMFKKRPVGSFFPDQVIGYLRVMCVIALTMLLTSQGFTTLGLSVMYGMPFWPTYLTRLPQSVLLLIVNSMLTMLLYRKVRLPYGFSLQKNPS